MKANKVILNNETIVDLTQDTVTENDVAVGKTFHKKDGTIAVGTATFNGITVNGQVVSEVVADGKSVGTGDFVELITGGYAPTHIDTVASSYYLATLLNENTIFVTYGRLTNSTTWDTVDIYSLTNNSWDRSAYDVETMMSANNPNRAIGRVSDTRAITVFSSYDTRGYDVVTGWEVGGATLKQTDWETSKDGENRWKQIVPHRVNDDCVAIFHDELNTDDDGGYKRRFKVDLFMFDSSDGSFRHWHSSAFWGTVAGLPYQTYLRCCAISENKFACVCTGKKSDGTVSDYLAIIGINNNVALVEKTAVLAYSPLETNTGTCQALFMVSDGGNTLYYSHGVYVCSIDISLDVSTFKELGTLSVGYGADAGAFFNDGRLLLFSSAAVTSYTMPNIAHEDTFAFPQSASGGYISVEQTSPNIFTVINPRDEYVMQVQVDNGRFKEAGNASGKVRPATSAKFIYGVAASDGSEGQYVDIIVPKLGENL